MELEIRNFLVGRERVFRKLLRYKNIFLLNFYFINKEIIRIYC